MKYNPGDKFVIEVESVLHSNPYDKFAPNGARYARVVDQLYKIKGFNSLVFDESGLDRLNKFCEPVFEGMEKESGPEFQVGDEVVCPNATVLRGIVMFVTRVIRDKDGKVTCVHTISRSGETYQISARYLERTGAHNPLIKDALRTPPCF